MRVRNVAIADAFAVNVDLTYLPTIEAKKETKMSDIYMTVAAPTEDKNAISVLFENIDILLKNKSAIINDPKNYFIAIRGCGMAGIGIGVIPLYLGELVCLWSEKSPWLRVVDSDTIYTYFIGGSALSGINFRKGWSVKEKRIVDFEGNGFAELLQPALAVINPNVKRREGIIERAENFYAARRKASQKTLHNLIAEMRSDYR